MPYSLILNLLPKSPIPPGYLSGRHLHALFLTLVNSVDAELATYLHDLKTDKPFTLSPLQITSQKKLTDKDYILQCVHRQPIPANTPCWWRISLLDDSLFSKLTQLWLNINPHQPWHLGPADLYISSILATPQSCQPWANSCSYQQLYERASESDRLLAFSLATPAAFRQGKFDTPLPTKESVFNSLINRWNKYSGIELDPQLVDAIFPCFFRIHTGIVSDSRSKFIGCLGQISYRIMGDLSCVDVRQINAIADFSLYCGIGRKTPMGMGMLRRING